jgi:hypothetical protein
MFERQMNCFACRLDMRKPLNPGDEFGIQYDVGPFRHDFTLSFDDAAIHIRCV